MFITSNVIQSLSGRQGKKVSKQIGKKHELLEEKFGSGSKFLNKGHLTRQ